MGTTDKIRTIYTTMTGSVIYGRGIGKHVGTPTADLRVKDQTKLPEIGVYTSKIILCDYIFYGVTHIGTRPTLDTDKRISVETHILNFDKEIYGCTITIELYQKIRNIIKFENLSLLLEQIKDDCQTAQKYWGINNPPAQLLMNKGTHRVTLDGQDIYLTVKEFDVLYLLYSNPSVSFTKEQIYRAVWNELPVGRCHAVENTVFQIRKKIKSVLHSHDYIKTIAGYGYKFNSW